MLALVGACTNPEVVIDVSNMSDGDLLVYSCRAGGNENDPEMNCKSYPVAGNQHSIGVYTSAPAMRVLFQFSGNATYCQQLDLSLAITPVDITYVPTRTAQDTALASCEPTTACMVLAPCTLPAASVP